MLYVIFQNLYVQFSESNSNDILYLDERTDTRRTITQASPNSQSESETDESLIFQMDDIDDSPQITTNAPSQPVISLTGRSQVIPNINVLSTRQSQIRDMPIERNVPLLCSQVSQNTDIQRHAESDIETQRFQCNPNIRLSQRTESHVSRMSIPQELPTCSRIIPNVDISRPRATYAVGTQSMCNPSIPVSERTESHAREMPVPQDLPRCSRHNLSESVSKPEESQVTDCAWCKIPSPSNEYVSERTEPHISEMPIPQDLPGCSRYNLNKNVSELEEPQILGASCMVSSYSNEYSSDSLPSLPSTSSDDSPPSYFKVESRSPTRRLSTSAPSIYDIPEPVPESESLKQTTLVGESTSENSPTSHLSELETLRIADSADRVRTSSESSSSIETLPSDMPNGTGNINGHPDLPSVCSTSASLNNTSVHNTPVQAEPAKQSTSQISSTANRLKLPSPEMSKTARRRKSSESSIETLSRDPANETSEDEHTTDKSPKKDD